MSVHEVVATVLASMQDEATGLAARVDALADKLLDGSAVARDRIRTDFQFTQWKLAGTMQPATAPYVIVRPSTQSSTAKQGNTRDSTIELQIAIDWFESDVESLAENITIGAAALDQLIDELWDYSQAHGGTIIDVAPDRQISFGEGPIASGVTALFKLYERSQI